MSIVYMQYLYTLFIYLFNHNPSKSSCACFEIIATEARNSKDFDDCAVDFVALIGYRTQALTVKRLAGRCGPIPTSMI